MNVKVSVVLALLVASAPASTSAHASSWESYSESTSLTTGIDWRTTDDSVRATTLLYWNSTKATNMRHAATHGYRFTFDTVDTSHNLHGYDGWTGMPSPYLDFDDDNGDWRNEEIELVSESSSFPTAGSTYRVNAYFSHWWYYPGMPTGWYWDPDGGTIGFWESLSEQKCCGDKWNTSICCAEVTPSRSYPYKAAPSGACCSLLIDGPPIATIEGVTIGSTEEAAVPYRVFAMDDPGEVFLEADLTAGLDSYALAARDVAVAALNAGPARSVVTFRRPISAEDVARLAAAGLVVDRIEAVSERDSTDGTRLTYSALADATAWERIAAAFAEEEVGSLGVVAVEGMVPDVATLRQIQSDDAVFLVDLSVAHFAQRHPEIRDVGQDGLYWELAGWN